MREPGGERVPRYFPIGEIARRTGMTARTIRYYEDIGLLASVRRVEGGRRVYTEDDIRRLKFVSRLKVLGLTLEEMKELEDLYLTHRSNDRVLPHLLELLDRHLAAIEARIEQLTVLKRDIQDYKQHIRSKI
jgi:DNA-binding transcriptional MerR regulator